MDYDWYEKADYWYRDEHLIRYQKMFVSVFEEFVKPGNALEIGSADGDFLNIIKNTCNLEKTHYNELVKMNRDEYDFDEYHIGAIDYLEMPEDMDNIFMIDVIEHLNNSKDAFKRIFSWLKPGGRMFILTNNGDAYNADHEFIYHFEHREIFSDKSMDLMLETEPCKKVLDWNSPFGLKFLVIERV